MIENKIYQAFEAVRPTQLLNKRQITYCAVRLREMPVQNSSRRKTEK